MKYFALLVAVALSLPVSGRAVSAGKIYSGTFSYNFESSTFKPDGRSDIWCIDGNMREAVLPVVVANYPDAHGTAHVVVRGQLSPPGHYCNMGALTYVLRVTEVINVKGKRAGYYHLHSN